METTLLAVFQEVARRGSFTGAAEVLGYTQSAVSRQISTLEHELGAALFDRLPRGVRLTEEGRCLLPHAEAITERLGTARGDLRALRELAAGRLRVGAFSTADAALVPQAMAAFRVAHPGVTLTLAAGFTRHLVRRLLDGDLDLAVIASPTSLPDAPPAAPGTAATSGRPSAPGSPATSGRPPGSGRADARAPAVPGDGAFAGLDLRHLLDDPMFVALHPDHPLAGRRELRLAELAGEDWIAGSARPEETLIRAALYTGFQPRIGHVAGEWIAKQGLVAAGLGITLVPSLAAGAARPDIVLVPLRAGDSPVRAVYAATPAGVAAPPALPAFLGFLDQAVARLGETLTRRAAPAGSDRGPA